MPKMSMKVFIQVHLIKKQLSKAVTDPTVKAAGCSAESEIKKKELPGGVTLQFSEFALFFPSQGKYGDLSTAVKPDRQAGNAATGTGVACHPPILPQTMV